MEGQSNKENPFELMTSNGNDVLYGLNNDPNQQFLMGGGRIENQPTVLPLLQWSQLQRASPNYAELLAENSKFLENASGADMLESITSAVGFKDFVDGVSEIQTELPINNLGKASSYQPQAASFDIDAQKEQIRYQRPHDEVEPGNKDTSFRQQILAQKHTLWKQEPYKDNCTASQLHPRVTVAPSVSLSKQQCHPTPPERSSIGIGRTPFSSRGRRSYATRRTSRETDMQRRIRIAERIRSLQELLPHSVEGNQAAILDDIVDHVKFLQLQIKELSRNRLGGESISSPFVFMEGYGHYVINEQMTNEPLEEILGNLLETNPSAASQLLESRGLYLMPISFAGGSSHAS